MYWTNIFNTFRDPHFVRLVGKHSVAPAPREGGATEALINRGNRGKSKGKKVSTTIVGIQGAIRLAII